MEVASRVCNVVAEVLVLLITWRVTYNVRKVARLLNRDASLSSLLFRDGAPHFMINSPKAHQPILQEHFTSGQLIVTWLIILPKDSL